MPDVGGPSERARRELSSQLLAHGGRSRLGAYVTVIDSARLRDLDRSFEDAAMDLGARPWTVFVAVTMPMIAPSMIAGGMMAFALSLDDLVIASFVSGPGSTTLPMEIFAAVRLGVKPDINAVASLIILAVSILTFCSWAVARHLSRRRNDATAEHDTATPVHAVSDRHDAWIQARDPKTSYQVVTHQPDV